MKIKLLIFLFFFNGVLFAFEDLTQENFEVKTIGKNVILDFYSQTWDACKALGESLTIYNKNKQEDVVIYKVDIDKQKSLAKEFSVRVIPTLIYFKDDEIIERELGIKTPALIKQSVKTYLLDNWFNYNFKL